MAETIISSYPGALDTTTSLMNDVVNLKSFILSGAHTDAVTTITTSGTITGITAPNYLLIDSEVIHFTGISGTGFTGCTRGADGTTAASHVDASTIYHVVAANYHNQLRRAIIAIETYLSTGAAAKGTILAATAANQLGALAVGANDTVLTAASGEATGLKWGTGSKIIQVVNTQTGAVATGVVGIPWDDTIPQITEGDQYMTLAITPTNTNNILYIEVVAILAYTTADRITAALFQDATAGALAAAGEYTGTTSTAIVINFIHKMTAGTISATTFRVRAGGTISTTQTTTFNGEGGARKQGGVLASSITITEVGA